MTYTYVRTKDWDALYRDDDMILEGNDLNVDEVIEAVTGERLQIICVKIGELAPVGFILPKKLSFLKKLEAWKKACY